MTQTCQDYYSRLTAGIDPNEVTEWEGEIANAERQRLNDRSVMDIIGSATLPVTLNAEPDLTPMEVREASSEWLQLALQVEEKQ
jgi:hypothetical protein